MKHFYSIPDFKPLAIFMLLFGSLSTMAQVMISYDGNNGKDMVASMKSTDGNNGDVEIYDFTYNEDRTLKSLKYTGYYEDEMEQIIMDYLWNDGRLSVSVGYQGMNLGSQDFELNASHNVTVDNSNDDYYYTFIYDSDGYVISITEDGVPGTLTWSDGNMVEFQCGSYKRTLSYTSIDNNLNMDLGLTGFAMEGFPCMPMGRWSKSFPECIKEYINGELSYEGHLVYSFDDAGRVIKMELNAEEIENGRHEPYTATLEISYDKSFETSVKNTVVRDMPLQYYDISGYRRNGFGHGINIVKGSDGVTRKMLIRK